MFKQIFALIPIIAAVLANEKTILLSNDDGWAALNIRAAYRELTNAGYNVILSAPARQRSGWSGKFQIPDSKTLKEAGEFNYPPKGSPSWGHESDNNKIWYFDGTPGAAVAFGLEYVIPNYFNDTKVDLVVNGPNEGTNLGNGMYTISGTIGATYNAVYRNYPGIAISGSNGNNSFFKDFENDENDTLLAANIYAKKVVQFVDQLFKGAKDDSILPITTGLNINFPSVGYDDESCKDPEWVFTKFSGKDSTTSDLKYNKESGLFESSSIGSEALYTCVFGNCSLEGESQLLADKNCKTSVSAFSVDYSASKDQEETIHGALNGLF